MNNITRFVCIWNNQYFWETFNSFEVSSLLLCNDGDGPRLYNTWEGGGDISLGSNPISVQFRVRIFSIPPVFWGGGGGGDCTLWFTQTWKGSSQENLVHLLMQRCKRSTEFSHQKRMCLCSQNEMHVNSKTQNVSSAWLVLKELRRAQRHSCGDYTAFSTSPIIQHLKQHDFWWTIEAFFPFFQR